MVEFESEDNDEAEPLLYPERFLPCMKMWKGI
jgi:hypothetical protein